VEQEQKEPKEQKEEQPTTYVTPELNLIASASHFVLQKPDDTPKEQPPIDPGASEAEW
jgi:hypothetical protein